MTFLSSLRLRPRHAKPRPMFRPCLESLEARLVLTVPILSPAYPIAPSWATAGAPAKPIEVEGSNFVATSTVDFNGAPLTTAFISTNELVATIPASDLTTVGANAITVVNPGPGGGTSSPLPFTVIAGPASTPTLQFSAGSETINETNGAFSIPVTLTRPPAPTVSTFASGIHSPGALAFDASGNLYVDNNYFSTVTKITPAGAVTTLPFKFSAPDALAFDASGNLYVANNGNGTVSKVTPAGQVSTFASGFNHPTSLAFDAAGNLYVGNSATIYVGNSLVGTAASIDEVTSAGVVSQFYYQFGANLRL